MGTFSVKLQEFADKTNKRAELVVRSIVFQIDESIQLKSPVGDAKFWKRQPPPGYVGGKFKANWQIGIEAVNASTANAPEDKDGVTDRHKGETAGATFAGSKTYLTNSVDYAGRIEDGTGSPRQAPVGVVGITVTEFEPIVKAAVAAAKAL